MNENADITHVSDTAIWVATYRADESERPQPLFQDPLARVLSGERGRKIAAQMPYTRITAWVLVIRTIAIDRLIQQAIQDGADTVWNLGAGLDTRPYRMKLPKSLRWVEVDFPNMIEYKSQKLRDQTPVCDLERISADLSDANVRKQLFASLAKSSKKIVVLTEGVIPYLSREDAENLSRDLFAVPQVQYWIQDYRQGGMARMAPKRLRSVLKDAPFKFDVADWLQFFTQQGWKIGKNILAMKVAQEVGRPFPFIFPWSLLAYVMPQKTKEKWYRASGYVMYQKS